MVKTGTANFDEGDFVAIIPYFENAEVPGKRYFRCSKLCATLSVDACVERYTAVNAIQRKESACRGCEIGAAHSGTVARVDFRERCCHCLGATPYHLRFGMCPRCYLAMRGAVAARVMTFRGRAVAVKAASMVDAATALVAKETGVVIVSRAMPAPMAYAKAPRPVRQPSGRAKRVFRAVAVFLPDMWEGYGIATL